MEHFPDNDRDDEPPTERQEAPKLRFEQLDTNDETRSIMLLARLMGANIGQVVRALKECAPDLTDRSLAAGIQALGKTNLNSRISRFGSSDAYFASLKARGLSEECRARFAPAIRAFLLRTAPNEFWRSERKMRAIAHYLLCEANETAYTACAVMNRMMGTTMKYGSVDQQIRRRVEAMTARGDNDEPAVLDRRARDEFATELRRGYAWDDPLTDEELAEGARSADPVLRQVRALSDTDPTSWRRSAVARAFVLSMKQEGASGLEIAYALHYGFGFPLWTADTFQKTDVDKLPHTFTDVEGAEAERMVRYAREAYRIAMRVHNIPKEARRKLVEKTWHGINRMRERAHVFPQFRQLAETISRRGRMAQLMRLDYATSRPGGTGDPRHELIISLEPPTQTVGHSKEVIAQYWEFVAAIKQDLTDAQEGLVSILGPAAAGIQIDRIIISQHKWTPHKGGADDRFIVNLPKEQTQ